MKYILEYPQAKNALLEWYHEILVSDYHNFNQLKAKFPDASLVGDKRVVFNILGNKFRLVVRIVFEYRVVQIKWFGTHSAYDAIDVTSIKYRR